MRSAAAWARVCRQSTSWCAAPAGQIRDGGRHALTGPVVLYESDEKVGIITLNPPNKLNAISAQLQHALLDVFHKAGRLFKAALRNAPRSRCPCSCNRAALPSR